MRDYGQIVSTITGAPWLITKDSLAVILNIVDRRIDGDRLDEETIRAQVTRAEKTNAPRNARPQGKTGVLKLYGPIFPKANLMTEFSGGTDLTTFRQNLRTLVSDENVDNIVLDIDSPGGSSLLVEETANEIRAAKEVKPIYAVASGMACSAAYWIASQATELYQTPSGYTGSVGAFMVHTDESSYLEGKGIVETVIKAGRFKAAEITPLNQDNREYLQGIVNDAYDSFVQSVAAGRGTTVEDVTANYGEGGIVSAKNALESGMIDGIAEFDAVLGSVATEGSVVSMSIPRYSQGVGVYNGVFASEREMEHSEPGSGSGGEPEPRVPPEDEDIDTWDKGERWDDPNKGVHNMSREQLVALAAKLDVEVSDELTDDKLLELVNKELDVVIADNAEIREAAASATKTLDFAKQYPEQAKELEEARKERLETKSKLFAADFERIKDSSGNPTNTGLSVLARQEIEEAHQKLSQNVLIADDLATLIHTVATGVVAYGEKGSSRTEETRELVNLDNSVEVRQRVADLVKAKMEEDHLDHRTARKAVFDENPDLARAYMAPVR